MLRAPDIAVGNMPDAPGWINDVPLLAVEYADTGQNEPDLRLKIAEFLREGTKLVWVVRLTGLPRVEVHEAGRQARVVGLDDELTAPGILRNPVPVRALFEREASHKATFHNLLNEYGYDSLDEVRAEGRADGRAEGKAEGKAEALFKVLASRGWPLQKPSDSSS